MEFINQFITRGHHLVAYPNHSCFPVKAYLVAHPCFSSGLILLSLQSTNIAMENGPFIVDLPMENHHFP